MNKWRNYGVRLKSAASFSTVGLELALAVGLGYWLGDYFDEWCGTAPWGMISFVLLGSAAGFLNLYRTLKRVQKAQDDE